MKLDVALDSLRTMPSWLALHRVTLGEVRLLPIGKVGIFLKSG